ncbi:MAG TPA: hypothetical protein VF073_02570, partial [Gaiella sp.]
MHPSVITAAASSGAEHGDDENKEQREAHPTDDPPDFRQRQAGTGPSSEPNTEAVLLNRIGSSRHCLGEPSAHACRVHR